MSHQSTPLIPRHFLVKRHAPSHANKAFEAMYAGDTSLFTPEFLATPDKDHSVTTHGVERTMRASTYLSRHVFPKYQPKKVFVSSFLRARQTYLHLYLPPSIPHELCDEITELSWGEMPKVHPAEWRSRFPAFYEKLEQDSWHAVRPGGESYACVSKRIDPFLSRVTRNHAQDVVLAITHGNILETLFAKLADMTPNAFHEWRGSREDVGASFHNLDVHHYTHIHPTSGEYVPRHIWYREIHAGRDAPSITKWQRIR